MSRWLLSLVLALALVVLGAPALADGTGSIAAGSGIITNFSTPRQVWGKVVYKNTLSHQWVHVDVYLDRRPGTGSTTWTQLSYGQASGSGTTLSAVTNRFTFECGKDYRVRAFGYVGLEIPHARASRMFYRDNTC